MRDWHDAWREIGDRIWVRRYTSLDLNVGVVAGEGELLVLDTRGSARQGRELGEQLRDLRPEPLRYVVNSHLHWDHAFGNASFPNTQLWGHERCRIGLLETAEQQREALLARLDGAAREDLEATEIVAPDHTFQKVAVLEVGGRRVELRYLGRGHTDSDLVLSVPDGNVIFGGDLLEEGAPPYFGDGYPLEWPATLERLLSLAQGAVVVPGHGEVGDAPFVRAQLDLQEAVAQAARNAHGEGRSVDDALARMPLPADAARDALTRAYLQLDGALG